MLVENLLETDPVCLALDAFGDILVPLRFLSGIPAAVQGARVRMRMFMGEWFLNQEEGVPWLENAVVTADEAIIGNKFNPSRTRAQLVPVILKTPAIIQVPVLSFDFNSRTRRLDITWQGRTQFGDTPIDVLSHNLTGVAS